MEEMTFFENGRHTSLGSNLGSNLGSKKSSWNVCNLTMGLTLFNDFLVLSPRRPQRIHSESCRDSVTSDPPEVNRFVTNF